jgi:hypothetical protein
VRQEAWLRAIHEGEKEEKRMPNYYTKHTAVETIPCDKATFKHLERLLADPDPRTDPERTKLWEQNGCEYHGFQVENHGMKEVEVYLYSENGTADQIPPDFRKEFGKVIRAAGKPYLEVGWAATCDRECPGSHHGGEWRLYPDGSIVLAELVYPSADQPESAGAAA